MAVLLSLLAAAAYGLSDFVGGTAARRTSPWAIAFVSQLGGALVTLVAAPLVGGTLSGADLGWAVLAGVGNGVGTSFLYRGLSAGRMGVVAPVSGVGAAVLPVLVGVATGERPDLLVWCGVLIALPAIWLVASEPRDPASTPSPGGGGLLDGVLAGLGFGTLFAALGQVGDGAGLLPFTVNQLVGAVVVVAVASTLRTPWQPRSAAAGLGAVSGTLGVLATLAFAAATRRGLLTLSAVITSLYPAFTVLLAATVLRERVHRLQAVGLGLCVASVVLSAAGG